MEDAQKCGRRHNLYWWVDEIYTGLRSEQSKGQCLLVIIGVTPEGEKDLVAIGDKYRESKDSCNRSCSISKRVACKPGHYSPPATGRWVSGQPSKKCFPPPGHGAVGFTR